jgi:hypothetical protein
MKPVRAPVVAREGLYAALFDGEEVFRVRARNARHAEEKLMFLVKRETSGKTLDFSLEQIKYEEEEAKNG